MRKQFLQFGPIYTSLMNKCRFYPCFEVEYIETILHAFEIVSTISNNTFQDEILGGICKILVIKC